MVEMDFFALIQWKQFFLLDRNSVQFNFTIGEKTIFKQKGLK